LVTRERDGSKRGEVVAVDSVIYVDGERVPGVLPLEQTYDVARAQDGLAWITLYEPDQADLTSVANEFGLHKLAIEDTIKAHQRAKLERYGETLFVVLKSARYLDEPETIEFGELHVFVGPNFVVTVRHSGAPDLTSVRTRIEDEGDFLCRGSEAILYAILDRVVDGYAPVVAGLENDIDEIEEQVFSGSPDASRRVYELLREVLEFQRATKPLSSIVTTLIADFETNGTDPELQRYLRDVQDHVARINERVEGFRQLLQNILNVNLTIVSLAQNEEIKKISAWAAILFAPTLVGTIYGMNFEHMPELGWLLGYPFAMVLMAAVCGALYLVFSRRGWL
jgi:magnesium transporter